MSRVQAAVLAVIVLAAFVAPIGAGADGARDRAVATGPDAAFVEADRVAFRITVYENASARWTFVFTRSLDNETERQAFRDFAAGFNAGETAAYDDFRRQARALAAGGTNQTGREMAATGFGKRAYVGGDCVQATGCGTVEMWFTWTGFARADGSRLVVDDVFEGGLYLGSSQTLVFEHGPELGFLSASPESYVPSGTGIRGSDSITWTGERQFPDRRPRVVFAPPSAIATPTVTAGPSTSESPPNSPASPGGGPPTMLFLGLLVILVGVGAAAVYRRGGDGLAIPGGGNAGGAGAATADSTVTDEELMSDEDRVLSMLSENGGRMKQVAIVEHTGWSKSKVSMLLSEMEDAGEISKLRVGRENIVSLAGHEPDAAGSPHDE